MGPIGRGGGWWVGAPELKDWRLAPSLCDLGKNGGRCTWLRVSAMRARVWVAGGVEADMRQTKLNFQDSGNA
eukprot:1147995-Pelagomonas_calceolata.AAC.13